VTFGHEEKSMSIRRAGTLALALSLVACQSVTQEPRPERLVLATFSSPTIPLPNDLALNAVPTLTAPQLAAQKALLEAFNAAGGFPSDQEVAISIPVKALRLDSTTNSYVADSAPSIDPASVTSSSVVVFRIDVSPPQRVNVDYDVTTAGTLTLRKQADPSGSRRWTPGARYVAAIRGGAGGVKATSGLAVEADQAITLVAANLDLSIKDNQPPGGLTPALVSQLESLRKALWLPLPWCNMPVLPAPVLAAGLVPGWNPVASPSLAPLCSPAAVMPTTSAFAAVSAAFPPAEVASITTFTVAPEAGTYVTVDSGSGVAPLPFDLMRDPIPGFIDAAADTGLILPNPAFGAAGVGLATLDGFSTTGMVIAQTGGNAVAGGNIIATGGAILAATVTSSTAQLHRRAADGSWSQVLAIATQPTAIQAPCSAATPTVKCSLLISFQPAVGVGKPAATPPAANNLVSLPPLDENTLYAVVVTTGVHDAAGQPLIRPTVGKILLGIDPAIPLGAVIGGAPTSFLGGVPGVTAVGLQKMRGELTDLFTKAAIDKTTVAMAYTFKTQSITHTATLLAGLPYQVDMGAWAASGNTQVAITPVSATPLPFAAFPGVPTAGVNAFMDVGFMSVDAIDKSTGALNPAIADPAQVAGLLTQLHALVVVPDPANPAIAACPAGYPAGLKCPMLVIFGHGLNGSRETLLTNAATLASAGFIAAAIDFPLHGGRNWCGADADCVNVLDGSAGAAGSCDKGGAFAGSATQGDAVRPGVCAGGTTPLVFSAPGVNVGSRYFVSSNFFRVRDSFRQNVLDVSALTLSLNRPPAAAGYPPQPGAGTNPFADALVALGLVVNPTTTYYEGISLGSIAGTSAVAANPRISRALLSVGGGTAFDIFTTSPAFHAGTGALLASLIPGFSWEAIDPSNPAFNPAIAGAYLKTAVVAKWILDPGDPINYAASYRAGGELADFLADPTLSTPQGPKAVLGQVAALDQVVPNTNNWLLFELMGLNTTYYVSGSATGGAVPHGMLASIASVQADAAGFLFTGTATTSTVTLP
jgi:hypothetical protein